MQRENFSQREKRQCKKVGSVDGRIHRGGKSLLRISLPKG